MNIPRHAREKRLVVKHFDIKDAPGVDTVGDLPDRYFLQKLRKLSFHSVLCSNLREHVPNRTEVHVALTSMVSDGGYLFGSCPWK